MFLILLAATVVACNQTPCPEKNWEEEYLQAKAEIRTMQTEITQLRVDTTALRGEILCLQSKLRANGLSIKCLDEPAVKKVNPAPAPKKSVKKATPVPIPAPTPKSKRISTPTPPVDIQIEPITEQLSEEADLSVYELFYDRGKNYGEVVWQINNLAGGHIPHLTMMKGYKFKEVCDNIQGTGYNFVIRYTTPGFTEDYGLTDDGIMYVKKKIVDLSYRWKIETIACRFTNHWDNVQAKIMSDKNGTVYGVNIMHLLK